MLNPKKIAIIGAEGSGKTYLSNQLGQYFNEPVAEEYARTYLTTLNNPYTEADLYEIARGQYQNEISAMESARQFLFCDTDLMNIVFWSELKFTRSATILLQLAAKADYDAFLILPPSAHWTPDDQREYPAMEDRWMLHHNYLSVLLFENKPFHLIGSSIPLKEVIPVVTAWGLKL
jgi:nicotinamide riboside kinase